ncbi:helix-turn-helix domain-containing protein [Pseudacidovorax intermedius]|uniref:helix-turn-helix domain-containing protein n=1 Tax=Pseudacidovorax intermedius TaxID=433924 RepID=UPI0009E8DB30|nr:helix-turn-helix domain-containing protein [Pseudacidovorax intermedius]
MDWHPAQVKAALEMADTNLSRLAKKHGYAHINEVLHRPWLAAEKIVAGALGKKAEEIWPSRYSRSRDRAEKLTRNPKAIGKRTRVGRGAK